jgi:hypothetical protein
VGCTNSIFPAKTPIQPPRLTSPRTGRITPKNSEGDRSYELDLAGKTACPPVRATGRTPSLERLAECIEDGTWELGKLVEQEHAAVRECSGVS